MAGITNYLERKILEHLVGIANLPSAPTMLYIGLNSTDDDAGGSEITNTYFSGRASFATSGFTSPATVGTNRQIAASSAINFSGATSSGSAAYYSIWDSASGGNCLVVDKFINSSGADTPLTFSTGDSPSIAANTLKINLSLTGFTTYRRDIDLNWFRGITAPSTVSPYLGIATAAASDGTSTEVTSTIRVAGRIQVTSWNAIAFALGRAYTRNTPDIDFGASAGAVSGVAYFPLWNAASSGNMLIFPALGITRNVEISDPVKILANDYRIEQG